MMRGFVVLFSLLVLSANVALAAAKTRPDFANDRSPDVRSARTDSALASISGFVRDSATGETLLGATIRVRALKKGALTNKSGYFSLRLPAAIPLLVEVTSLGYKTERVTITLNPDDELRKDFLLSQQRLEGKEITVESDRERERERQEPQVSRVNIQPAQIAQLPKAGEADLFRILQLLPGVQTSSEISSGLYIRGGSTDQNLILLDGTVLYNPSHFFGFFSTFNSDAIKDVELIKGGFPAEYGGRLSAVLSVTDKDGDRNAMHGKVSLGAIASRATIDVPVGTGAFSISGRRTYIDVVLKATGLQQSLDLPNYHFYDLNGKLTQNPSPNDKISLSGYGGADDLNFASDQAGSSILMNWGNRAGSLDWTHVFSSNFFSKLTASYSNYFSNLSAGSGAEGFTWNNNIYDYSLNGSMEYFNTERNKIKAGFQATAYQVLFKVLSGNNPPTGNLDLRPYYGALYMQDEWKPNINGNAEAGSSDDVTLDPLAINLGLRVDGISSKGGLGIDPRISARYILTPAITLKASFGVYHQYLKLATNNVIPVFDVWLPVDSTQGASKALQYVLGVSTVPMYGYSLEVEGYYKSMSNLVEMRPNVIGGKSLSDIFFVGDGRAYGIEFFLQKQMGDLTGWIGYTLAWTKRTFPDINQGREFPPTYDRRNDLDVVLTYRINDRWTVGSTFTYGTGQAYSQIVALAPNAESPNREIPIQGDKNGLRLAPYNRLDLSGTYSFSLFNDRRNASFNIDIYNAYNHRNVWISQVDQSTNPATINYVKLLPILPTFGLQVEF